MKTLFIAAAALLLTAFVPAEASSRVSNGSHDHAKARKMSRTERKQVRLSEKAQEENARVQSLMMYNQLLESSRELPRHSYEAEASRPGYFRPRKSRAGA